MKVFEFSQEYEKENLEKKGKLTPELEESLDGKCGGCNWESDHLFVLAKTKQEAKKLLFNRYSGDGAGMCGECFSSFMSEYEFTFTKKIKEKEVDCTSDCDNCKQDKDTCELRLPRV